MQTDNSVHPFLPLFDFGDISLAIRQRARERFGLLVIFCLTYLLSALTISFTGLAMRSVSGLIIAFIVLHFIDKRVLRMLCTTFEYQYLVGILLLGTGVSIYGAILEPHSTINYVLTAAVDSTFISLLAVVVISCDAAATLSRNQKLFLFCSASLFGLGLLVFLRVSFFAKHPICVALWCTDTINIMTSAITTLSLFTLKYCVSLLLWPNHLIILKSKIAMYSS